MIHDASAIAASEPSADASEAEGWAARPFQLPTPVVIRSISDDNYRTKTFELDARLSAAPGQFVMAWLPRFDEKPFSLVDIDPVTLMVTAVGPFTRLLHEKRVGDTLWIRGPFGNGFRRPRPGLRAAFVGGGYGVAPLLWLARAWRKQLAALTVVIGAGTAADLLYADCFRQLEEAFAADKAALRLLLCTEDGSAGTTGRVTDALTSRLEAGEIDMICACGPDGMLSALDRLERSLASRASFPGRLICAAALASAAPANTTAKCFASTGRCCNRANRANAAYSTRLRSIEARESVLAPSAGRGRIR